MKIHRLAIDETGSFTMAVEDKSFVCGVSVSANEENIKQIYKQCYEAFGLGTPVPNDTKLLIGKKGGAAFHFNSLSDKKKEICRTNLLPLADKIFVSQGKPTLYANNQNWWLVAVTVVIQKFLKAEPFENGDKAEIIIDNRNDITFGVIKEKGTPDIGFKEYHNILINQIQNSICKIAQARGIEVEIRFSSDTSSFFVNLADVVCGIVRKERNVLTQPIVKCNCSLFMSGNDPAIFVKSNPMTALTLVFQEVSNNDFQNVELINKDFLNQLALNVDNYAFAMDMFYDLLKTKISERGTVGNLTKLNGLADTFLHELKRPSVQEKIPAAKQLDLMILLVEYYSHIGATMMPFDRNGILATIKSTDEKSETRLLRKWEKYVSFSLREAQIDFNAYNFGAATNRFETLWGEQENITKAMPEFFENKKDEPTTAIIGTLAQSYAYNGELTKATEYFEMSKEYAVKTSSKTASYLFTIYHRQKDVANARLCFKEQIGKTPEEYAEKKDFGDAWQLLSYCKLRALELYVNKSTTLAAVDLKVLSKHNREYPFPLVQKWEGIALWLENADANKPIVEKYFTDAINTLQNEQNGFAIRTLALPIIQCYARVNNQNPFHAKYNKLLNVLKNQSTNFAKFADTKPILLNDIKDKDDIWECAMLLPFIYA